ncbi:hypothetical protein QYE76_027785, partial [Lolium multiflorum]
CLDQAQLKASGWVGCELGMQRSSSGRLRELAGADDSGVGWTKVALGAVADVSEWKLGNSSSGQVQVSAVRSEAQISARGLYITLARGNFSFFHLLTHVVFFLAPRRSTDLISGELCHGELHAPPVQASPRAKILSVEREILPATDSWSREAISCKSGDLDSTGAPSSHRAINGRIPSLKELQEELEGQARMAAKVQEAENKRASKARNREGERGQWWPCETTDVELRELQNEGMISAHWSFIRDTDVPKPGAGEVVMTKAWVERGLSLPCSEFFLSILNTYGLQPHNICPNSYLLLSNFVTLCEGHLGIRPDVRLWQFFFRVKKETKDKAMVNCGSMTFMLRPGRMYPPHDSHESVRYWNAGWFYEKNASVPDIHDGLPKFINEPPEELASWSFVPSLAQTPILEKAARRISWLVHDRLTGAQLTLSCSILWRRKAFAPFFVSHIGGARRRFGRRRGRRGAGTPQGGSSTFEAFRAKASGSEAGASGEASAKKPKPPPLNSKKAERERLKMLSTAGRRSRPIIPGAPNPSTTATRTSNPEPITKYMKKSPAVGPTTPAPPSTSHTAPQTSPPQADQSPPPAANSPPEIVPISSEKVGEEDPKAKGPAQEDAEEQGRGEAEVTSSEKTGAGAGDIVVFPKNFGDPADLTSTPKAYATKFFNKLTEAEKWELEQDLLNAMLNNAWGKPDAATSEIQDFKKDVGQFFNKLICFLIEAVAPKHYGGKVPAIMLSSW